MDKRCCDPGVLWLGQPQGTVEKLGGVETYVARPETDTGKAAVLVHDAFGFDRVNPRLLADAYAKAGFLTVLPNLFGDDALTEEGMPTVMDWVARHPVGSETVMATLAALISELRLVHGVTKVTTEGFCWGGWYSAALAATDKVDAATIAHGSLLTIEAIEAIKQPTQFVCAEEDAQWPQDFKDKVAEVIEGKDVPCVMKTYPATAHGFAVRGEMGAKDGVILANIFVGEEGLDAPTTTGAAKAAQDTIDWWNRHTGSA